MLRVAQVAPSTYIAELESFGNAGLLTRGLMFEQCPILGRIQTIVLIMNIAALIINFVGALLLVADSFRMSRRILNEGFTLGYESKYIRCYWRYYGFIGFFLMLVGFALQIWAEFKKINIS